MGWDHISLLIIKFNNTTSSTKHQVGQYGKTAKIVVLAEVVAKVELYVGRCS